MSLISFGVEGSLKMEVSFEVMKGEKTAREREAERKMLCVLLLAFTNSTRTSTVPAAACFSRLSCLLMMPFKR